MAPPRRGGGLVRPPDRHLQGVEESTASRGGVQSVFLDKEGQTITYLSYFSRASPGRPGTCACPWGTLSAMTPP